MLLGIKSIYQNPVKEYDELLILELSANWLNLSYHQVRVVIREQQSLIRLPNGLVNQVPQQAAFLHGQNVGAQVKVFQH